MFLPENIDFNFSEKYILSIRLLPGGFSFSVFCPSDPSIFYHKETSFTNKLSYLDNIKKLIFDFSFFSQAFKETRVSIVSTEYLIVPDTYFDGKYLKDLFSFNFIDYNGVLKSNPLPEIKSYIVFNIDEELHSFLSRSLWNPVFMHQTQLLVPFYIKHNTQAKRKRCYINFNNKFIDIICCDGENILTANTYEINARFDALYFITGVWEKLPLDQSEDLLFITGFIEENKETIDTLKKLIRNIELVILNAKTMVPEELKSNVPTDIILQL